MKYSVLLLFTLFLGIQSVHASSLAGKVWSDLNNNNSKDADEPGLPNVTFHLYSYPAGELLATEISDTDGLYIFDNITAANYIIAVDIKTAPIGLKKIAMTNDPAVWSSSLNCDFYQNGQSDAIVISNDNLAINNLDLGVQASPTSIISGMSWEDVDANNIRENGESGIENIIVTLIDTGSNVIYTETTNAMGQYTFPPADSGSYTVLFDPNSFPENFHPVLQDVGLDDNIDSDANASGVTSSINLSTDITNIDLGLKNSPNTENIGGKVWYDANMNGLYEDTEIGIANVFVRLFDESNTELGVDTTDSVGKYLFSGIASGNYYIEFDTSSYAPGYIVTSKDEGTDDDIDSDAFESGKTDVFIFTLTESNIDMGVYTPPTTGAASGKVWQDQNSDNTYSFGEPLINAISVFLINTSGDTIQTEITDNLGQYAFANIEPDSYKIAFELNTLPADFTIVEMNFGSDDSEDCDVNALGVSNFITITAGNTATFIDLGYRIPIVITPLTTDTIAVSVEQNGVASICLDTSELTGVVDNAHICIAPSNGEATDFVDNCFSYFPDLDFYGEDSFCVVICDDTRCDTTIVNLSITQLINKQPVALNDIDTVVQGNPKQLMILSNDTLFAPLKELKILEYPTLGAAQVDTFGFINYIPEPNICDETVVLKYEVCTQFGCDTAEVTIFIECNNISIVGGFSPNGDGINDTFVIKGINEYPNNTLTIFNRWGAQVLQQEKYDNTWDGFWDKENTYLPVGTYFYIFDNGEGGRLTGSFELNR